MSVDDPSDDLALRDIAVRDTGNLENKQFYCLFFFFFRLTVNEKAVAVSCEFMETHLN